MGYTGIWPSKNSLQNYLAIFGCTGEQMSDAIATSEATVVVLSSSYGPIALSVHRLRSALATARQLAPGLEVLPEASPGGRTVSPRLVNVNDAARILGVPPTWLLQRAREQRVPHYRIGKYIRFDPAEIRAKTHQKSDRHANS